MELSSKGLRGWNIVLAGFMICTECLVVDRDRKRMRAGYKCPACGHKSDGARVYFHVNIMVLIDLIEESYFSTSTGRSDERVDSSSVAILLYFCTLKEALFEHFLNQLFTSMGVKESLRNRLLSDNRLFNEKINKLFPALVSEKWSQALSLAGKTSGRDFAGLDVLLVKAAEMRNGFLHDASPWGISPEFAAECVDALDDLLCLFVGLHNHYIHRLLVPEA